MIRSLRLISLTFCVAVLLSMATCSSSSTDRDSRQPQSTATYKFKADAGDIPPGASALAEAYPDLIAGYSNNMIFFSDGDSIIYDDGRDKDFPAMLDDSDIEDMFAIAYDGSGARPGYLVDPGRSRCDALFKKMYGASAEEVRSRLVEVDWFGEKVRFTPTNGAADSLRAVSAELAQHPELSPYLKSSGTFNWRQVRGARRMSAHSYGIAFDIGVEHSDYWLWKHPGAAETDSIAYANRIPRPIIEIFQRHGFIWGGAWYHFDTMHFEFRPELLKGRIKIVDSIAL